LPIIYPDLRLDYKVATHPCAEGAHGLFDERDDVILSGDISSHEQGASTSRSNLLGELLSLGNAAPGDDHIRAFFGKRQDSGFADARVTSSNKDSLVFEGFHNWPQRSECRFFGKVNGALSFATLGPPKGKHDPGRYEEPSPSESLWRTVE
jgi:hypothetical protein